MLIKTEETPFEFSDLSALKESCVANGINYQAVMDRLSRELRRISDEETFTYELRAAQARQAAKDKLARAKCRQRGDPELYMIVDKRIDARMAQQAGSDWIHNKSDVRFLKNRNLCTVV